MRSFGLLLMMGFGLMVSESFAQAAPDTESAEPTTKQLPDREQLFSQFSDLLQKSVMVGTFTVDGDNEQKRRSERYEISKVVKQPQGDYWNFLARIKYGEHNVMLPIPVEVKWAGDTPVITVDNLTIPSMGTFDARVVISDHKYAGTWRHGKVGGLMFGHIKKQADEAKTDDAPRSTDDDADSSE